MNKLVSIIVPVYNVEAYIHTCMESILYQTYENIEIILVDDGATDSSGKICDEYKYVDSRVKVIHKANGGLSDARNVGMKSANGEYLIFIDSDDIISKNYVEYLVNLLEGADADVGVCSQVHIYPGDKVEFTQENNHIILDSESAIVELLYQKSFLVSAWAKIYKKKLFEGIEYPVGKLFEDSATTYKVFDKAKTIVYGDAKLYGYVHRENSITTRSFSKKDCDILTICQEIVDCMSLRGKRMQNAARCYQVVGALRIFLNAPRTGTYYDEIEYSKKIIRQNGWKVLVDKGVRKKTRLALLLFFFARPVMPWIYSKVDRWK